MLGIRFCRCGIAVDILKSPISSALFGCGRLFLLFLIFFLLLNYFESIIFILCIIDCSIMLHMLILLSHFLL